MGNGRYASYNDLGNIEEGRGHRQHDVSNDQTVDANGPCQPLKDVASSHTVGQDQACINQGAGHPNLADPNNTRGGRFRKQPRNTAPPGRAQPDARGEGAKVAARNGFSAAAAVAKDGGQGELKPEGGAQKRAQQGGGATANSRGKARPGQNPHAENNFSKSSNLVNGQ